MTWTVRVIAGPASAAGYRLAGLPTDEVGSPAAAVAALQARYQEPGLGVLVIEQNLLDATPDALRREVERRPIPIIVPAPRPAWGAEAVDAEGLILDLLRRAIGYRVKLR